MEAIATVYFPEFQARISELVLAALEYEGWMLEAGQKRLKEEPSFAANFAPSYQLYLDKSGQLMEEFREYAKREFGDERAKTRRFRPWNGISL